MNIILINNLIKKFVKSNNTFNPFDDDFNIEELKSKAFKELEVLRNENTSVELVGEVEHCIKSMLVMNEMFNLLMDTPASPSGKLTACSSLWLGHSKVKDNRQAM